ncbi:MAG TPA: AarF/UbiB family protein [Candidatus Saccharimonadales bacterium]|nr:AarF/UbiB family protein [Candidatus Saccharimonadales bacterium]
MKFSLNPHHLKRYKDILYLFLKYSSSDLAKDVAASNFWKDEAAPQISENPQAQELTDELERMGPTFVKIGQLLSSRADLLPEAYLNALTRLQDKVTPFPYSEVETIIETELGVRLSKAFSCFDSKPVAAASLGQVHQAKLRDGRAVVVKVQRPGIRKIIAEDFEILEEMALFFDNHTKMGRRYRFSKLLDEFKETLLQELDYQREASNLTRLSESLKEFTKITVPLPVADYTTRSVLTMDFIHGTKITRLSPLARLDINGEALADELFRAYLKQVLVDGLFHADPHPGNIFLTEDNKIALLDLGMVGRTTPGTQQELLKLLLAISEGEAEQALEIILAMSETADDFNEMEFRRKISRQIADQQNSTVEQMDIGKALLTVGKISAETGLYVPPELTMIGKTLLQLDQIARTLAPEFNPNACVRRNASELMSKKIWKDASPGKLLGSVLQLRDFVTGLPPRLNKVLDTVGNAEMEIKVRTPDAEHLMSGFQKVANRITTGIILASLIIGASLLMQVNTSFVLFGYPGIAMLCFLVAGGGGLWLVLSIIVKDYRDKRRTRH